MELSRVSLWPKKILEESGNIFVKCLEVIQLTLKLAPGDSLPGQHLPVMSRASMTDGNIKISI